MYLTEKEIMSQHEALLQTVEYIKKKSEETKLFFEKNTSRKFVLLGCGSSYMLAKSGERFLSVCKDTSASAIAGGDYLIHEEYYKETIKDSIIITLSRSGQTTEIVRSVKSIKEKYGNPVISLSMKEDNDVMLYSDLDYTMDWCYDKSVCQTRTVTNLYTALLMLTGIYSGDDCLLEEISHVVSRNEEYKETYRPVLKEIAKKDWDNAIILADGPVTGIGEEGALAYTEISMLSGKCFNMLDYRHGPMVLNDEKTLTVVLLNEGEDKLQGDMVADLKTHGGVIVTVSTDKENKYDVDAHICIGDIKDFRVYGIPFIYVMQMSAYEKAILLERNPDAPTGLDAFITLT